MWTKIFTACSLISVVLLLASCNHEALKEAQAAPIEVAVPVAQAAPAAVPAAPVAPAPPPQEPAAPEKLEAAAAPAAPAELAKAEETPISPGKKDAPASKPDAKKLFKVKALYLTGWTVGNPKNVEHFVNLAKETEINAYVIDIKDDDGNVGYESQVPEVREIGAWKKKYDVDKVLAAFHENNIHVIGRLVCFKDPVCSVKHPDWAIKDASGGLWHDGHKLSWLSPCKHEAWAYNVAIAKEALKKGFDEIQFDYVRFASDGHTKNMRFGADNIERHRVINEYLAYARKELPNAVLSADIFGIVCESPEDTEHIGQYLEYVGREMDFISPMAYPSHYALGQIINGTKYAKPDLDPYGVVFNTLVKAKKRIGEVPGYRAQVRPYLQNFTASWLGKGCYKVYGAEDVRQQIKAVYDAGYDQWILWNAGNKYTESALLKKSEAAKTASAKN